MISIVGNVDFNKNVYDALCGYFKIKAHRSINWTAPDFKVFFDKEEWEENDFVYPAPLI